MGFVPHPNSYYYLVAVHSGKVLEVADASKADGALIQQGDAKPYTDSEHQHFSFNWNAEGVWVLRARHSQRVIDVQNASQDDVATVQQWAWHGVDHERFHVIDAGDGTFFLQALHSGKVLEVYGEEKAAGKPVRQFHNLNNGKNLHQRFRPVLAEEGFAPEQLPGFTNPSQMMRELTLGVAGLIPEAGGAIKGVVSLFWPTDTANMIWNQVIRYIETYVENKIAELTVTTLRNAIDGARKNLRYFDSLIPGQEKADTLNSILVALNVDRAFLDPATGDKTLSYLVTMGTIKLTALQERARNFAAIANSPVDVNQQAHFKSLREDIAEYTHAAERLSSKALSDRLDKIGHHFEFTPSLVTLRDGGDGTVLWYRYRVLHPNEDDKQAAMRYLYDGRKATVETQFGAQLDAIVAPALLWYAFDPDKPRPQTRTVRGSTGPYGNATTAVDLTGGQPLGKIEVWWGDVNLIRGLRITSRAGTAKMVGYEKGTLKEMTLAAGEVVAGIYGSAQFNVHSLVLETTFGQRLAAGDLFSGLIFHADLPPELGARLVGITASADANSVASIQFQWEYVLTGNWPPKSFLLATLPEGYVLSEDAT